MSAPSPIEQITSWIAEQKAERDRCDFSTLNVWPTRWAGGSESVKYDGHKTIWLDSDRGEVARIRPEAGRVTEQVYARANALASSFTSLPQALEMLERALERLQAHGERFPNLVEQDLSSLADILTKKGGEGL